MQTIEAGTKQAPVYENGYRFEREEKAGRFLVRIIRQLRGGREKQEKYYSFRTLEAREDHISKALKQAGEMQAWKAGQQAAKKTARAEFINPYKAGDVLYCSWGYDQTNVNFYQVLKTTARTVTFQEIGCESVGNPGGSDMSDMVHSRKEAFLKNSKPETRAVQFYVGQDGKPRFYVSYDRKSLDLDNGQKHYKSWYA